MESEVLSEKVEWEARRVAAAFGVEKWRKKRPSPDIPLNCHCFKSVGSPYFVEWMLRKQQGELVFFCARDSSNESVEICLSERVGGDVWEYSGSPKFNDFMARGLYSLGFEDEDVLAELNHPLTAHEQLELRLSMPRE